MLYSPSQDKLDEKFIKMCGAICWNKYTVLSDRNCTLNVLNPA